MRLLIEAYGRRAGHVFAGKKASKRAVIDEAMAGVATAHIAGQGIPYLNRFRGLL